MTTALSNSADTVRKTAFSDNLKVQGNVLGALLMRELHTRYGRENVGYLWMIGEPMLLAVVVGLIHSARPAHYAGGIPPVPFAILGYTLYIMFRGIFNRSEGALESNLPLLYHKMVTVFDIVISRALLEAAGTFVTFSILMAFCASFGLTDLPARPLYLLLGVFYLFWFSIACSMIVVGTTHDNRLLGRLVHPISYFLMPLSGAFYQLAWLPLPYRNWMEWFPLVPMFELMRYGQFQAAKDEYINYIYLTGSCLVLSLLGFIAIKLVRAKIHLH